MKKIRYLEILDFGSNGGDNSGNFVTGNGREFRGPKATINLKRWTDFFIKA